MKVNSKITVSNRVIVVFLIALLAFSAFNTYLIFERTSGPANTSAISYDFVVSQVGGYYQLKNMLTGYTTSTKTLFEGASSTINEALSQGKSVYLNPGTYILDQDILVSNKLNAKIVGDGATIIGNGKKIIISGDDYTKSQYATISGLTIINATVRIENSFGTTISNMIFENT